ncbi:MAG: hypothetical protein V1875_05735 [Candidatus Altiarchaeota archaeon]
MRKSRICIALLALALAGLAFSPLFAQAQAKKDAGAITQIKNELIKPAQETNLLLFGSVLEGLEDNPRVYCPPGACTVSPGIDILMHIWSSLLVPFYVIALLFTALFFLIKAGTPRGRARARSMFLKLIFGMVLVVASPMIYQFLLDLSAKMVKFFFGMYGTAAHPAVINLFIVRIPLELNPFQEFDQSSNFNLLSAMINSTGLNMNCIFASFESLVLLSGQIIMWVRKLMILFYATFFPLIIFMYSFEVTKPEGNKWLNGALKWIFVPPLQAIILVFMTAIAKDIHFSLGMMTFSVSGIIDAVSLKLISDSMAGCIFLAGIAGFVFAPLLITQLMSWLGNAVVAVGLGTGNQWMVALGGLLAGGGSGAIIQADAEYARGSALQRYMNSMQSTGSLGSRGGHPSGAAGSPGGAAGGSGGSDMWGPGILGDSEMEGAAGIDGTQRGKGAQKGGSVYSGFSNPSHKDQGTEDEEARPAPKADETGLSSPLINPAKRQPSDRVGGFTPSELKSTLDNKGGQEEAMEGPGMTYDEQIQSLTRRPLHTVSSSQTSTDSERDVQAAGEPSGRTGKDISRPERTVSLGGGRPTPARQPRHAGARPAQQPDRSEEFRQEELRRLAGLAADKEKELAGIQEKKVIHKEVRGESQARKQKQANTEQTDQQTVDQKQASDKQADEKNQAGNDQEEGAETKRSNDAETRKGKK